MMTKIDISQIVDIIVDFKTNSIEVTLKDDSKESFQSKTIHLQSKDDCLNHMSHILDVIRMETHDVN